MAVRATQQSIFNQPARLKLSYPFSFEATEDFAGYRRDERGVPTVYYPHLKRWEYNPITISQYGLHQLALFERTGDPRGAVLGRTMADWLVENQEDWKHEIGAWVYRYHLPFYGPSQPWISAMAQGQAISLLLRVGQLGGTIVYEESSRRAVRAFFYSVAEGGVEQKFPDGAPVFEEFPTAEQSLVLNGFLFSLLGLRDYAVYFADARVQELFESCISGLRTNLPRYDTGFWNLYDLHRSHRLASPDYLRIHVQLLNIFASLTGDEYFARMARKWQSYLDRFGCRLRFSALKLIEKVRLRFQDFQPPHLQSTTRTSSNQKD